MSVTDCGIRGLPRPSQVVTIPAAFAVDPVFFTVDPGLPQLSRADPLVETDFLRIRSVSMSELDYTSIVESTHDIQNPINAEKLRLVAGYLGIVHGDQVIDIGSGRGWWSMELALRGATVTALESNEAFAGAARQRACDAGVGENVTTVLGAAAEFEREARSFDVATCLGASFALGGYRESLAWMAEVLRDNGRMAIGETHTLENVPAEDLPTLVELAHIVEEYGFEVTAVVSADVDDWDRYESLHWTNVQDWAARNPEHPQRSEILAESRRFRNQYLAQDRGRLGWSILVGVRKLSI